MEVLKKFWWVGWWVGGWVGFSKFGISWSWPVFVKVKAKFGLVGDQVGQAGDQVGPVKDQVGQGQGQELDNTYVVKNITS